jgi:glycosyltransferase involved in cell wall biosynthesis
VSGPNLEFFFLPFYHGPWQFAKKYIKILKTLEKVIETCDCAVLRIPDQLAFQIFNKVKKANLPCAVEVVAHSWDLYAPGTIKTVLRPLLRVLWDSNQKKLCKQADGVSYVTEKYIQKRYPSRIKEMDLERFETFYTSADLNPVYFGEARNRECFDKEVLNFVHVSGINNMAKGHYELLSVMADLKEQGYEHKLTFIGGGTLLNKFKELSKDMNIDDQVNFLGHLSNPSEIAEKLKASDMFVLPTMTEGLPRVILEAMAIGLPCIATNVGGIPELLSMDCLIPPNNINALREKIIYFLNNKKLLEKESGYNYNKILKNYTSIVITEKRTEFYQRLKKSAM